MSSFASRSNQLLLVSLILCSRVLAAEPVAVTLPNDLRLIVLPDASSRVVALSAFIKFSALHESRTTAGARELLQNAMLRGSTKRNATQIAQELAERGSSFNSAVDDDFVEFYATGGVGAWEYLFDLLAEVVMEPALDDREIEAVRTDLLGRVQLREDQLGGLVYDLFRGRLHSTPSGEPVGYGLAPAGYDDSLRRLTRASLRGYHRQYYVPNNMVVVVVGAVAVDDVVTRAKSTFRNFAKRSVSPVQVPSESTESEGLVLRERETDQTWLVLGFPAPPVTDPHFVPLRVANALLGEGMSSRLFKVLREDLRLAYDIANFCPVRAHASDVATHVAIQPQRDEQGRLAGLRLEETQQAILAEYDRLKTALVPEEELARARRYVVGSFALAHQRNRQKAWQLGRFECLGVGYNYDRRFPELVKQVTAEQIQEAAQQYFVKPSIAAIVPRALP